MLGFLARFPTSLNLPIRRYTLTFLCSERAYRKCTNCIDLADEWKALRRTQSTGIIKISVAAGLNVRASAKCGLKAFVGFLQFHGDAR